MGANRTQAVAIIFMLVAFVFLAGAFAGGGLLLAVAAAAAAGVSIFYFQKCKPWESAE
jgi:hypothetical protein